jgi:hypothetical protein
MQSLCSFRTSAFSGHQQLRPSAARPSISRASTVVVKAVQDVQGTVVSTAMNNTVIVSVERLAAHDKVLN